MSDPTPREQAIRQRLDAEGSCYSRARLEADMRWLLGQLRAEADQEQTYRVEFGLMTQAGKRIQVLEAENAKLRAERPQYPALAGEGAELIATVIHSPDGSERVEYERDRLRAEGPRCANGNHEWTNQFGNDWTPEVGTRCDCGTKQWGVPLDVRVVGDVPVSNTPSTSKDRSGVAAASGENPNPSPDRLRAEGQPPQDPQNNYARRLLVDDVATLRQQLENCDKRFQAEHQQRKDVQTAYNTEVAALRQQLAQAQQRVEGREVALCEMDEYVKALQARAEAAEQKIADLESQPGR